MPAVAFFFSQSPEGGYLSDDAICASLASDLIAESRRVGAVSAAIRSGGLMLHRFAYRRVEAKETEAFMGRPGFGWLEQAKMQACRYLLADFSELVRGSWHHGAVWVLDAALRNNGVEVYSVGPIELETAEQLHHGLTGTGGYLGCAELDLGHVVCYRTCWSGLGERFQVVDTELGFLDSWGMPEEEHWSLEPNDRWWHYVGASSIYWTRMDDEQFAHPSPVCAVQDSNRGSAARSALVRLMWPTPLERLVDTISPSELPPDTKSLSAAQLPGAEDARIPAEKLHGYALNLQHPTGGPKARLFRDLLGIVAADWRFLAEQLRRGVLRAPAFRSVSWNGFGVRFDVISVVKGRNAKILPVVSAWIVRPGEPPTLTTTFSAKRGIDIPTSDVAEVPVLSPDMDTDWELLWRTASAAARDAAALTVPEPICLRLGEDGPTEWILDGAEGFASVRMPDARRGFARWLRRSNHGGRGHRSGTWVYAPDRQYDKCVAWADAFAEVLAWHGVDCEVSAHLT